MGLRTIFMGTPAFGAACLRELARGPHCPTLAVSQPDRPAGRGRRIRPTPVHQAALDLGIPVLQPRGIRRSAFLEAIQAERPDVIVTAAFGRILPVAVLAVPRIAPINVHGSLLPRWRGAAPVQRAIMAGDRETGVTIFRMVEEMDAGDIYLARALPIPPEITGQELMEQLQALAVALLPEALDGLEQDRFTPIPQEASRVTLAPPLRKEEGRLDWSRPAEELERLIRAVQPWPGAECLLAEQRLGIRRARLEPLAEMAPPGTVIQADPKHGLVVAAGGGALRLEVVVRPGRRPVTGAELVRGSRLQPGQRLGSFEETA